MAGERSEELRPRETAAAEMAQFLTAAAGMFREQQPDPEAADAQLAEELAGQADRITSDVDKLYERYQTTRMGDVGTSRLGRQGFAELVDRYVTIRAAYGVALELKNSDNVAGAEWVSKNFEDFEKQAEAVRAEMAAAFGVVGTSSTESFTSGIGRAENVHRHEVTGKAGLPGDVSDILNDRMVVAAVTGGADYIQGYRAAVQRAGVESFQRPTTGS